jgi:ElaB/YqjD/DUF883 family membrane-anchored ribosome-binding protein
VRKDVNAFASKAKQDVVSAATDAQGRVVERMGEVETAIRAKPVQSTLVAAGIGFLLGLVLTHRG